jgi:transcription initiation factor TFIID subunit 13
MSYGHYPPGSGGTPVTTTYPYGTYPPPRIGAYGHPTFPGAYPYQPAAYQTGVTSYGWPYPYNYVPHLAQPVHPQRPGAQTPASVTAHTPQHAVPSTTAPPRSSAFTSYTRDSAAAAASSVTGRGSRKQSTVKGLFTKECETR